MVTLSDIGSTTLSNGSGSVAVRGSELIAKAVAPRMMRGATDGARGEETRRGPCCGGDWRGREPPEFGDFARTARPSR